MRRPFVCGNWKMHKTVADAVAFARELLAAPSLGAGAIDIAIAAPFTVLPALESLLAGSRIALAAQTMHWADAGAFTGEIAPPMLVELRVRYVILGHSERRAMCNETDAAVNKKVKAAIAHGLVPIVAVGESHDEHLAGHAVDRVVRQTRAAFAGVAPHDVARCVVAYEPIWAIGTGAVDTPENANRTMGAIREAMPALCDVRILYGGSAKPDNVAALCAMPNIDGALVGGASLSAASFADLITNAGGVRDRS
jgi:triosephosphate isomerase